MHTHNNYANTSAVEDFLYTAIYGKVSDHVYAGSLPSTTSLPWDDMVVIDCDLPIVDYDCYSTSTVYIFLYARPQADGSKNVVKLAEMERKLNDVLDGVVDAHYTINRQSNGGDYDTAINWHRNYVHLNIVITQ